MAPCYPDLSRHSLSTGRSLVRRLVAEGGSLRVRDVLRRVMVGRRATTRGCQAETAVELDEEMFAFSYELSSTSR